MDRKPTGIADPAAHQPGKAERNESVSVDVTPETLAWAA